MLMEQGIVFLKFFDLYPAADDYFKIRIINRQRS